MHSLLSGKKSAPLLFVLRPAARFSILLCVCVCVSVCGDAFGMKVLMGILLNQCVNNMKPHAPPFCERSCGAAIVANSVNSL